MRILGAGLMALLLAGCATPADRAWWRSFAGLPASPAQFHFDWQIAGDSSLAPLQVFDDGRQMWLQYPTDQVTPAVFARTASGDQLLRVRREGDYLVVGSVPARLVLRGGHLVAQVWRQGGPSGDTTTAVAKPAVPPDPAVPPAPTPALAPAPAPETMAVKPPVLSLPVPALPPSSVVLPVAPRAHFQATPADGNIRRALGRWARTAAWTFEAEHWAVDVDIPLAGSADFGGEFIPAVRNLLAATELGDRPLQPCFYANQVLRVIPLAQRCDRTQAPGVSS